MSECNDSEIFSSSYFIAVNTIFSYSHSLGTLNHDIIDTVQLDRAEHHHNLLQTPIIYLLANGWDQEEKEGKSCNGLMFLTGLHHSMSSCISSGIQLLCTAYQSLSLTQLPL